MKFAMWCHECEYGRHRFCIDGNITMASSCDCPYCVHFGASS